MDSAVPILVEDLNGIIIDLNSEAERTYQFDRQDLIGKPIKTLVPHERHQQADDLLKRCLNGEDVRNIEGLRCTQDGKKQKVLVTLSALKNESGEIVAVATIAKDITELKAAEGELRQLAKVFKDSADPILIEDLEGIVIDMNDAAEHTYGFSREELVGKPIKTLVPQERHVQADDLLLRCLQGEEVRDVEGIRTTRNNKDHPVLLTLSAIKDEFGNCVAIATMAKNISDLKAVEHDLRDERENLENRVKERTKDLNQARSELQELAEKFSKYLSPEVYKSLFEGSMEARIEARRTWLTVFFCDLVGFTPISEKLGPEELTTLLNEYLFEMTAIVSKYGGTLDKYIGDAILVFFGDPHSKGREEDAYACVSMALEMKERLKVLRKHWALSGQREGLRMRVGISSGFCTVGNFGSDQHMSYTIIGREVNLASRLESSASADEIVISKPTWALINDRIHTVACTPIEAKGFEEPVAIYRVIGTEDPNKNFGVIQKSGPGFSLWFDPEQASENNREDTLKFLKRALTLMQGAD